MDQLKQCPDKPNCVSSQSKTEYAKIAPFSIKTNLEETKKHITSIMNNLPRTSLIKNEGNYLHFTAKTKFIRFTDDVEFLIDEPNKTVHIRSASRIGYKDFGTNRKRVEFIRNNW